jgi:NADPH:quinone reductase-like Zn-dependent oxidoreductase
VTAIFKHRQLCARDGADLAKIAALIKDGKVRPHVAKTFALEWAADTQEKLKQGGIAGKIVLTVGGTSLTQ